MKTIEYFRIEARDEFSGHLDHVDVVDAISNMNKVEQTAFSTALHELDEEQVGSIIIRSIFRQYAETIEEIAKRNYADYLESVKDDFEDIRRDAA